MASKILCCKRGKMWIPDQFLTTVFDNCSRGKFVITRSFSFPCTLLPNGNVYVDEREGVELPVALAHADASETAGHVSLGDIRCGACGGEVEIRDVEQKDILQRLRTQEITMKQRARDSGKIDKNAPR